MELRQLYYFTVCAQMHSFSRAAEVLYTTQSNVSKVIRSLELELGTALFERKQYGISLTEKGAQVYDDAQATLESARKIMAYTRNTQSRQLRILTNPSSWMSASFCQFYRKYRDSDTYYSIITASTNSILRRLEEKRDDLGFIYLMEAQLPMLEGRLERNHLFFTPLKKTVSQLYVGAKADPGEIDRLELIQGYEDEFTLHSFWNEKENEKSGLSGHRIAVTTNSDYVMKELLKTTNLGNISGGYLSHPEELEVESAVPLYGQERPVIFGYLARNDRNMERAEVEFLKFIRERIEGRE